MSDYFKPDSTGFYLAIHSWTVLADPKITPTAESKIGTTLYRENAASDYARQFFPMLASASGEDLRLQKRILIQSAELSDFLKPKSWRLEGRFSKDKTRPQTVQSNWPDAEKMLKDARQKESGQEAATPESLVSRERALEVLSVEAKLVKNQWTLDDLVSNAERTKLDTQLPHITIHAAVAEYLAWAKVQTQTPISKDNPRPKLSPDTLISHTRFLGMVGRYFKPTDQLVLLKNAATIQAFCQGSDPIPMPTVMTKNQAKCKGKSAYGYTKRPWTITTVAVCASVIGVLLDWAATPGIQHPGGARCYLSPLDEDKDLWFPDIVEDGVYILNAKTGTPYEYRSWLDLAWPTRFAARVALEIFAGLRPAEICAQDSYINWDECQFWVGASCKTGHRIVPLMDNLMTMLFVLKLEGRCYLKWNKNRDAKAKTILNAKMGYQVADCIIESNCGKVENFRAKYPINYHKTTNPETGKDEWIEWGFYTKKCPRHTFGSVVYAASLCNAGVVGGLLGHRESQFLDAYAGKVHAELWHGSIYRACRSFCQCLPKQLRALGTREQDMGLPAWFLIQRDDRKAANRTRLLELATKALANADEPTRRQVDAVKNNLKFLPTIKEIAAEFDVDRGTVRVWLAMEGFPPSTSSGYILEEVQAWAQANHQPVLTGRRAAKLKPTTLPDGRTVIPKWEDLAKALGVNAVTLKNNWARLEGFPVKTAAGHILEDVAAWLKANGHYSRPQPGADQNSVPDAGTQPPNGEVGPQDGQLT